MGVVGKFRTNKIVFPLSSHLYLAVPPLIALFARPVIGMSPASDKAETRPLLPQRRISLLAG